MWRWGGGEEGAEGPGSDPARVQDTGGGKCHHLLPAAARHDNSDNGSRTTGKGKHRRMMGKDGGEEREGRMRAKGGMDGRGKSNHSHL